MAHIVKKFENTGIDKDDLLSIGTFGLIKAIDTFNFDATNKLATYAARCIENEILMHIRSNKKEKIQCHYTHQLVKIKKEMKSDYVILSKIQHLLSAIL
ncbi:MAG: sigma factor [Bacilli bacterium]